MHPYLPNTQAQVTEMLRAIGAASLEELFDDIPEELRMKKPLALSEGMSEMEVLAHLDTLAKKNRNLSDLVSFLGAGVCDHHIPSVIGHLVSRQEFTTAYTPYQPEISQGTLQAIFEYQTMICRLTGMAASNASMYDGASALAEACAISSGMFRDRHEILLARTIHPHARQVVRTYLRNRNGTVKEIGYDNGQLDLAELEKTCGEQTAAVCIQTPNFYGVIEDMESISRVVKQSGAMFVVFTDPISLAILEPPGSFGADFAVGEGVNLGNPPAYGGPHLGFLATTQAHIRKMPGRVVGETTDREGNRGYVLTLQTREQHIRREKATSNICTNQALCALAATVYMAVAGKRGLVDIAVRCLNHARYAHAKLLETGKFREVFTAPFFKEFLLAPAQNPEQLNAALLKHGYLGGYIVGKEDPVQAGNWLVAVTEKRTREQIEDFAQKAGEALK